MLSHNPLFSSGVRPWTRPRNRQSKKSTASLLAPVRDYTRGHLAFPQGDWSFAGTPNDTEISTILQRRHLCATRQRSGWRIVIPLKVPANLLLAAAGERTRLIGRGAQAVHSLPLLERVLPSNALPRLWPTEQKLHTPKNALRKSA